MEKYKANYIKGLYAKKPHPNAPKFIISNISMKRLDLIDYLQNSTDEYINARIKDGQKGYYVELDTYKPVKKDTGELPKEEVPDFNKMVDDTLIPEKYPNDDVDLNDIPF